MNHRYELILVEFILQMVCQYLVYHAFVLILILESTTILFAFNNIVRFPKRVRLVEMNSDIYFYNTLTRKKEPFQAINSPKVKIFLVISIC